MSQTYGKLLATLLIVFLLAACSGNPLREDKVTPLNLGEPKTFVYPKNDENGEQIPPRFLVSALIKDMYRVSGIRPVFRKNTAIPGHYDVLGIEVTSEKNVISVAYVKGGYSSHSNSSTLTKSISLFPYSIEQKGDAIEFIVLPATSLKTERYNVMGLNVGPSQLMPDNQMAENLSQIFEGIRPVIKHHKIVSGQIDVGYNNESVVANFERLLEQYKSTPGGLKITPKENSHVYALDYQSSKLPLMIEVYPYRDGSKINYEFSFPYSIEPGERIVIDQEGIDTLTSLVRDTAGD